MEYNRQQTKMKKLFVMLCIMTFAFGVTTNAEKINTSNAQQDSEVLLAMEEPDDDDMEIIKTNVKAWYWSGNYMSGWMSHDAKIGRNKQDGSYWIKVTPIGPDLVCPVEKNPDYDGGWSGGRRTAMTHMASSCGYNTYYFDL